MLFLIRLKLFSRIAEGENFLSDECDFSDVSGLVFSGDNLRRDMAVRSCDLVQLLVVGKVD